MWLAVQSLSQLEVVYGKARAQVLRDNMESQLYYRPTDVATARYVEERCGRQSAYAHHTTEQLTEAQCRDRGHRHSHARALVSDGPGVADALGRHVDRLGPLRSIHTRQLRRHGC